MRSDGPRIKKRELLGQDVEHPIDGAYHRLFLLGADQVTVRRGGIRKDALPKLESKRFIRNQQAYFGVVGVRTGIQVIGSDVRQTSVDNQRLCVQRKIRRNLEVRIDPLAS